MAMILARHGGGQGLCRQRRHRQPETVWRRQKSRLGEIRYNCRRMLPFLPLSGCLKARKAA